MCIGVPVRLLAAGTNRAPCEGRGERSTIDLQLVGPQAPGAWLLAFQGTAVRVLSAEEALQTNQALDALQAALEGESNLDRFFADLVDRAPQLPPHLRKG